MYQLHDGQSLIQSARIIQAANMCRNFSFCIAFLLLVHMSSAILTGASNSEEFKISKVASSSLESIDDKADKTAIRNKRGFDYSDYSPESSEENIAYFHRPQYIAYPSHWPHHSQHRLPPTPHTDLSRRRKRRNSISVDDVDDEENDAVFPSRPFFISKGRLRSYETIAVPLSVGSFKRRKKRDSTYTYEDQKEGIVPSSKSRSFSRACTSCDETIEVSNNVNLSLDNIVYIPKRQKKEIFIDGETAHLRASSISYGYLDHIAVKRSTRSHDNNRRQLNSAPYKRHAPPPFHSPVEHHRPPYSPPHHNPPPPPPHHNPPPPPHHNPRRRPHHNPRRRPHHNPPPPHFHHQPPPHHHRNYPPPMSFHHHAPPPPPNYDFYTTSPTLHNIAKEDYISDISSSSVNGKNVDDNSTEDMHLNDKIESIFGSSTTEQPFDGSSLIDIRIKD